MIIVTRIQRKLLDSLVLAAGLIALSVLGLSPADAQDAAEPAGGLPQESIPAAVVATGPDLEGAASWCLQNLEDCKKALDAGVDDPNVQRWCSSAPTSCQTVVTIFEGITQATSAAQVPPAQQSDDASSDDQWKQLCYQPGVDRGGVDMVACQAGTGLGSTGDWIMGELNNGGNTSDAGPSPVGTGAGDGSGGTGGQMTPYGVAMGIGLICMVGTLLWGIKGVVSDQGRSVRAWQVMGEMGIRASIFIPVVLVAPGIVGIFRDMITIPMSDYLYSQSGGFYGTLLTSFKETFADNFGPIDTFIIKGVGSAIVFMIVAIIGIVLMIVLKIELLISDIGIMVALVFFPIAMGLAVDPQKRNLATNMITGVFIVLFTRPVVWLVMWTATFAQKLFIDTGQWDQLDQVLSLAGISGTCAAAPAIAGVIMRGLIASSLAGVMGGAVGATTAMPRQASSGISSGLRGAGESMSSSSSSEGEGGGGSGSGGGGAGLMKAGRIAGGGPAGVVGAGVGAVVGGIRKVVKQGVSKAQDRSQDALGGGLSPGGMAEGD